MKTEREETSYTNSMHLTPTKPHMDGGAPPSNHESPLNPPKPKILTRINCTQLTNAAVFNTLYHVLVTINGVPLYGYFHFTRSYP